MSKNDPVSLTREEMVALRLNPDTPFCSERLPGHRLDVRWGDTRITRSASGAISVYFGWFTPSQTAAREATGKALAHFFTKKMEENGGTAFMRFLRNG